MSDALEAATRTIELGEQGRTRLHSLHGVAMGAQQVAEMAGQVAQQAAGRYLESLAAVLEAHGLEAATLDLGQVKVDFARGVVTLPPAEPTEG